MRILLVLLAGATLLPASALGQTCVSSETTGISGDTLTLHGTDSGLASLIAGAEDIWDDCGMSGIPTISQGTGGDLDYTVYIVDVSSGPACGVTDPNAREITVARRYTYQGVQKYPDMR